MKKIEKEIIGLVISCLLGVIGGGLFILAASLRDIGEHSIAQSTPKVEAEAPEVHYSLPEGWTLERSTNGKVWRWIDNTGYTTSFIYISKAESIQSAWDWKEYNELVTDLEWAEVRN